MDEDPILCSALDIYADESTIKSTDGTLLNIYSSDDNIKLILHNLFYDILNVEFNLWTWVRNTCKYGDFYLILDLDEELGVKNVVPISSYDMSRIEGLNEENPNEVFFIYETAQSSSATSHKKQFENFEVAHFRLLTDTNFLPYGRSMLEPARKEYKRLSLMEDAMMIHRIMRAPQRRVYKISVGNLRPEEVDRYMQGIIAKTKKIPYVDERSGQYNLKFNLENMIEDIYIPVRGGDTETDVGTLDGMSNEGFIDDVDYIKNKMMAALKIPRAFLGYDENLEGKAVLAAEDVRFARTIERIQNIMVSELTKIAIVHLFTQGYQDSSLVDFDLKLNGPSIVYERQKIDILNEKMTLAANMKDSDLFSRKFIYDNAFTLTDDQQSDLQKELLADKMFMYRLEQIGTTGADPTQKKPEDTKKDSEDQTDKTPSETPAEKPTEEEGKRGRPEATSNFGSYRDTVNGRDPLGFKNTQADIGSNSSAFASEKNDEFTYIGGLLKELKHSKLNKILSEE